MESGGRSDEELLRSVVAGLVAGAVVIFGLLALLYFWQFGAQGLSPKQEHWGQFGDFLGGTLNPVLGFTSVVLLALTLSEQRKMLAESRKRAVLEELQRLLSARSQRLDEALAATFDARGTAVEFLVWTGMGLPPRPSFVFDPTDKSEPVRVYVDRAVGWIKSGRMTNGQLQSVGYAPLVQGALRQLHSLHECLSEFLSRGGDPLIGRLYGSQYAETIALLRSLDALAMYPPGMLDFSAGAARQFGQQEALKKLETVLERYRTLWAGQSAVEAAG